MATKTVVVALRLQADLVKRIDLYKDHLAASEKLSRNQVAARLLTQALDALDAKRQSDFDRPVVVTSHERREVELVTAKDLPDPHDAPTVEMKLPPLSRSSRTRRT